MGFKRNDSLSPPMLRLSLIPNAEIGSQKISKFPPTTWVSLDTVQFLISTTEHKASYVPQLTQGAGDHGPKETYHIVVKNRKTGGTKMVE